MCYRYQRSNGGCTQFNSQKNTRQNNKTGANAQDRSYRCTFDSKFKMNICPMKIGATFYRKKIKIESIINIVSKAAARQTETILGNFRKN